MLFKKREAKREGYFERMKQEHMEKAALNGTDLFRPF
jgi:hypothetical protein